MKSNPVGTNPTSIKRAILWGLGQALALVLVCGVAVGAVALLQRWEASADGFLDKVALLLLFVTAALVSVIVVLARPAYLALKQRLAEGVLLVLSTTAWLALMVGSVLIVIKVFDVHTIF
jgi:hypothetical protein